MNNQRQPCRLYLITPPRIELDIFSEQLKAALGGGDVAALQIRLKETSDEDVLRACDVLASITSAYNVALIVNDRPDLALTAGVDGVHIGQGDMGYSDARKLLGPQKTIGVTCHDSRHLAMEAAEAGADYVAFGAFFPTTTKDTVATASVDLLEWWNEIFELPSVAIGGITIANCAPLVTAGADFLAVINGVWGFAAGPAAAVKAFNTVIASARQD